MNYSSIFKLSQLFLISLFLPTQLKAAHLTPEQTLQTINNEKTGHITATPEDIENWNDIYAIHKIIIEGTYNHPKNLDVKVEYSVENTLNWQPLTDLISSGYIFNETIDVLFDPYEKVHKINLRIIDNEGNETMLDPIEYLDVNYMEFDPFPDCVYNGEPHYLNVTSPEAENENFIVTNYENNVNAGTAWFSIEGKFPETIGTRYCEFTILPAKIEGEIVLLQDEFDFKGEDIYPEYYLNGPVANLEYGYYGDYDVIFENNHYAGTATIRIEGKRNYEGSISSTFNINKINCPEEWISYSLPNEDITFDAESHPAFAYEVDGSGERIISYVVNGLESFDSPINPGDYEVFLEYTEGPGLYAVPKRKIGQFSIYELNDDDWNNLVALTYELTKENDANSIWSSPITDERSSAAWLHNNELTITQGKITSLNLVDRNLKGELPMSAFNFKNLETINLSYNQFTGDIGNFAALRKVNPNAMKSLKYLYLNNNYIHGNAGSLSLFPDLEYIDISFNRISDVIPMIGADKYLCYNDQYLDLDLTIDLREFDLEKISSKIPTIAFYDHANQSYSPQGLELLISDERDWNVKLLIEDGMPYGYTSYNDIVFTGSQGDVLTATLLPNNCKTKAAFYFKPGDVDFNTVVNLLDIQSTINYILDKRYHSGLYDPLWYDPVNFTAANLYEDDVVNVQDIVCLVNLILDSDPTIMPRYKKVSPVSESSDIGASIFIDNGIITLTSNTEIAAFDIIVDNDDVTIESIPGFGITKKSYDGKTRLIGYSISGATIPEGSVRIGRTWTTNISYAMLSDVRAKEIPVTLNESQTDVPVIETDLLIEVLTENIRLNIPQGINTTWQIATADGLILLSGSQCASGEGIMIPFKADDGRIYVISVGYEGKNIHKKLIKK
ncbi:MAG: hypothetical protein K2K25_12125 [Muribaculaceae bacterium]|nr:hypothetical protein [Muribaculaceae bacterium]